MRSLLPIVPSSLAIGSERPYADLNSVFHSFFNHNPSPQGGQHGGLRSKLTESEDGFLLQAELPGLKREDIELNVLGDLVMLSGRFGEAAADTDKAPTQESEELRSGSFEREFKLSSPVETEAVKASFVDGILRVELPKAASAKPRRIDVQN